MSANPAISTTHQASRSAMVEGLRLSATASTFPALGNPYSHDASARIKADSGIPAANFQHFANFLASSSFQHCVDAWSYLGRSVSALLTGDTEVSGHMAYYAELRACAALLASEGIYVGNFYNAIVDSTTSVIANGTLGTHRAMWALYEQWAMSPGADRLFRNIFAPGGVPIDSWVSPGGAVGILPARTWMYDNASIDLEQYSDDQIFRNHLSYHPVGLGAGSNIPAAFEVAAGLWEMFEPSRPNEYASLDLQIYRRTLWDAHVQSPVADWKTWISSTVPSSIAVGALEHSLLSYSGPSSASEGFFGQNVGNLSDKNDVFSSVKGMLARAAMMLRLATGSVNYLFSESGKRPSDLPQWLDVYGVSRGYWRAGDQPLDRMDLWSDLEDDVVAALEAATGSDGFSSYELFGALPGRLGEFERVMLWNVA